MRTVHEAFWAILPTALLIAEVKRGFPGKAVEILGELADLEITRGQTGYLGTEDDGITGGQLAAMRVDELISVKYGNADPPTWMLSAGI